MGLALKAENISKQYRLGQVGTGTISHDLNRFWHQIRGKEDPYLKIGESNDRTQKGNSDYVWSLQNINFEINQGDAVGIIGRNGAGKSTLLKLLSKVTKPTTGKIHTKGRIASLLEVGTGFHPEMTGRENIFLNGAILGMTRKEITRKFDEIVDFSGVEKYIDTPVKRYSSGMYVRLAFAVAAHLESEILIVDEVLAVGDAEFQKKCLGKMGDVSKGEGRTVLFVSHNLSAVKQLCNSGLLLEHGLLKIHSTVDNTLNAYLKGEEKQDYYLESFEKFTVLESPYFKPLKFGLVNNDLSPLIGFTQNDKDIQVYIEFQADELHDKLTYGIAVFNIMDELMFWSFHKDSHESVWPKLKKGKNSILVSIPSRVLNQGEYKVVLISSIHYKYWITDPEINPPVINLTIQGGLSDSEFWLEKRPGVIAPVLRYKEL